MSDSIPISVIMPTFNTAIPILKEAVESILGQTFRTFEFIIVDDCSTNGSDAYLRSLDDPRVRLIRNAVNLGVTKSLNIALRAARGRYIARMDSDDISMPERLEKQYVFMVRHPDVIMCGTDVHNFGMRSSNYVTRIRDMERYRIKALFYYPGPLHPTIMLDHEKLTQNGIFYDESLVYAQDYGLYTVLCEHGRIANINEFLLCYRTHDGQVSVRRRPRQRQCDIMTQKRQLRALLPGITDEQAERHYRFSYERALHGFEDLRACAAWYARLVRANNRVRKYNRWKFALFTWRTFCLTAIQSLAPGVLSRLYAVRNRAVTKDTEQTAREK